MTDVLVTVPGAYIAASRMLWTLGRDDAVPYSSWVKQVSPRWRNPFNAQLILTAIIVVLGCIYIGSATAFNAFTGVFVILTTMSYLAAILPYMITRRKYVIPGPFRLPSPWAYIVLGIASAYIIVFNVIYMFPYSLPVDVSTTMNYSCVMTGGITLLLTPWYFWKRNRGYVGPKVVQTARNDITTGIIGRSDKEEVVRTILASQQIESG